MQSIEVEEGVGGNGREWEGMGESGREWERMGSGRECEGMSRIGKGWKSGGEWARRHWDGVGGTERQRGG